MSLAGIPESHYRNGDGPSMLGPLGPLGPLAAPSYVAANAATSAFSKNNCEFPTNKPFELSYNAGAPRGRRLSLQWQTSGVSGAPNIQLYLDASRGGNNVPAATTACPPRSGGSSPTTHTPCMLRLDGPGQQRQSGSLLHSMLMDEFSFRDCSADGGPVFPMTPTPVDIGIPFLPKQPSGSTTPLLETAGKQFWNRKSRPATPGLDGGESPGEAHYTMGSPRNRTSTSETVLSPTSMLFPPLFSSLFEKGPGPENKPVGSGTRSGASASSASISPPVPSALSPAAVFPALPYISRRVLPFDTLAPRRPKRCEAPAHDTDDEDEDDDDVDYCVKPRTSASRKSHKRQKWRSARAGPQPRREPAVTVAAPAPAHAPPDERSVTAKGGRADGETAKGCPHCKKRFLCESKLQRHLRTHTGEKPFACLCGQAFTQKSSLKTHIQRHACMKPKKGTVFVKHGIKKLCESQFHTHA